MTPNEIRRELLERDVTLPDWSRRHGYDPEMVRRVVTRYGDDPTKTPRGVKTFKILKELSNTIGRPVHPSLVA